MVQVLIFVDTHPFISLFLVVAAMAAIEEVACTYRARKAVKS